MNFRMATDYGAPSEWHYTRIKQKAHLYVRTAGDQFYRACGGQGVRSEKDLIPSSDTQDRCRRCAKELAALVADRLNPQEIQF